MKLDQKDRKIITLFSQDPQVSQDRIAQAVGLSQPSVAVRVKKLRDSGGIASQTGIDPLKMGLYVAKVDIATTNPAAILDMFRGCPYFANGFTVSGKNNLCLLFMSENIATLEAIVNGHLRSNQWVQEVDFNIVISAERDLIVPTALTIDRTGGPPCGTPTECRKCKSFLEKKCMGCPAIGQYQGWFY